MLASLLRPKKRRVYGDRSPFSSPCTARETTPILSRRHQSDAPETEGDETHDEDGTGYGHEDEDEDGLEDSTPLLPIFSAPHLGKDAYQGIERDLLTCPQMPSRFTTSPMPSASWLPLAVRPLSPGTSCGPRKSPSFSSSPSSKKSQNPTSPGQLCGH